MATSIQFHSLIKGLRISDKTKLQKWLYTTIKREQKIPGIINLIFCTDAYLLEINQQYLNHDYYTDIITFQYSDNQEISGDLYISIDRVKENAKEFEVSFKHELNRVMIHGVLHLCGYKDKSAKAKKEMKFKEDFYLNKLK